MREGLLSFTQKFYWSSRFHPRFMAQLNLTTYKIQKWNKKRVQTNDLDCTWSLRIPVQLIDEIAGTILI